MTRPLKSSVVLVAMLAMCTPIMAQDISAGAQEETKTVNDETKPTVD